MDLAWYQRVKPFRFRGKKMWMKDWSKTPASPLSQSQTMPKPNELGFKDTVMVYPGQVTRIRMRFDIPGIYVWHCHILSV